MMRKALLACGVVSSVMYVATDIVASRRYGGYNYADQVFSELTAQGSPVRPFMVVFNGIPYTLLVTAFAAGIATSAVPHRAARLTAAMLIGYAVAGIAGGVAFPMASRGTDSSLRNDMHIPATAVMSIFILLAMAFGAKLFGRRFRTYSCGTIALLVVFGILTSLQGGRIAADQPSPWVGIEERVNIYATMLWMVVLAVGLARAPSTMRTPRNEPRDAVGAGQGTSPASGSA